MYKVKKAFDISGRTMKIGDTVTTVAGDMTGKICDICVESEISFVQVRPLHQSSGRGLWHAADRTMWLSAVGRKKPKTTPYKRKG